MDIQVDMLGRQLDVRVWNLGEKTGLEINLEVIQLTSQVLRLDMTKEHSINLKGKNSKGLKSVAHQYLKI